MSKNNQRKGKGPGQKKNKNLSLTGFRGVSKKRKRARFSIDSCPLAKRKMSEKAKKRRKGPQMKTFYERNGFSSLSTWMIKESREFPIEFSFLFSILPLSSPCLFCLRQALSGETKKLSGVCRSYFFEFYVYYFVRVTLPTSTRRRRSTF